MVLQLDAFPPATSSHKLEMELSNSNAIYPVVEGHETRLFLTSRLFSKPDALKLFRLTPPKNKPVKLTAVIESSDGAVLCAYEIPLGTKYNRNGTQAVWLLNKQDTLLLEHQQLRMFLVFATSHVPEPGSARTDLTGIAVLGIEIDNQNYFKLDETYEFHEFYGLSIVRSLWTFSLAYNGLGFPPYKEVNGAAEYVFQITEGELTKQSSMAGYLLRSFNSTRHYLTELETNDFADCKLENLQSKNPLNFQTLCPTELPARSWNDEFSSEQGDIQILREFGFVKYIDDVKEKKQFSFEYPKDQSYSINLRNTSMQVGAPISISFLIDVVLQAESWDQGSNPKIKLPKLLKYSLKDLNSNRPRISPYLAVLQIKPKAPYLTMLSFGQKQQPRSLNNAVILGYDCEGTFRLLSYPNMTTLTNQTHLSSVQLKSPPRYGVQQTYTEIADLQHNHYLVFEYEPSPSVSSGFTNTTSTCLLKFSVDSCSEDEKIERDRPKLKKPQTPFFLSISDKWLDFALPMDSVGGTDSPNSAMEVTLSTPELVLETLNCTRCIDVVNTTNKIEIGGGSTNVIVRISRKNTTDSREHFGLAYLRNLGEIPTLPHNEQTLLHAGPGEQRYYLITIGLSTNNQMHRGDEEDRSQDGSSTHEPEEVLYFIPVAGKTYVSVEYFRSGDWEEWRSFQLKSNRSVMLSLTHGSNLMKLCGSFKLSCKLRISVRSLDDQLTADTSSVLVGIIYHNKVDMVLNLGYELPLFTDFQYRFTFTTQDWKQSVLGMKFDLFSYSEDVQFSVKASYKKTGPDVDYLYQEQNTAGRRFSYTYILEEVYNKLESQFTSIYNLQHIYQVDLHKQPITGKSAIEKSGGILIYADTWESPVIRLKLGNLVHVLAERFRNDNRVIPDPIFGARLLVEPVQTTCIYSETGRPFTYDVDHIEPSTSQRSAIDRNITSSGLVCWHFPEFYLYSKKILISMDTSEENIRWYGGLPPLVTIQLADEFKLSSRMIYRLAAVTGTDLDIYLKVFADFAEPFMGLQTLVASSPGATYNATLKQIWSWTRNSSDTVIWHLNAELFLRDVIENHLNNSRFYYVLKFSLRNLTVGTKDIYLRFLETERTQDVIGVAVDCYTQPHLHLGGTVFEQFTVQRRSEEESPDKIGLHRQVPKADLKLILPERLIIQIGLSISHNTIFLEPSQTKHRTLLDTEEVLELKLTDAVNNSKFRIRSARSMRRFSISSYMIWFEIENLRPGSGTQGFIEIPFIISPSKQYLGQLAGSSVLKYAIAVVPWVFDSAATLMELNKPYSLLSLPTSVLAEGEPAEPRSFQFPKELRVTAIRCRITNAVLPNSGESRGKHTWSRRARIFPDAFAR